MSLLRVGQQCLGQLAQAEKQHFAGGAAHVDGLLQALLQALPHLCIDAREHVGLVLVVHVGSAGADARPLGQLVKGQGGKTLLHGDLEDGLDDFIPFCCINRSHGYDNKRLFTYCQDPFRQNFQKEERGKTPLFLFSCPVSLGPSAPAGRYGSLPGSAWPPSSSGSTPAGIRRT